MLTLKARFDINMLWPMAGPTHGAAVGAWQGNVDLDNDPS